MKARTLLLALAIAACAFLAWAFATWRKQPPEVPFAHVVRESISSSITTNGRVEPIEWATARAERAGPVEKILIQRGQHVEKDAPLVELDNAKPRADLAAAQAHITQAQSDLEVMSRGGHAQDLAAIQSGIDQQKHELDVAQKDYEVLSRLQAKNAATPYEVSQASDRVAKAKLQIDAYQARKAALVAAPDRTAAEARLHDAEAQAALAQETIRQSVVRAPIAGTAYDFDLKPGAYLNAGDVVASTGVLDRVRVKVYVDEPDLGQVARGLPVVITWDAKRGQEWQGTVDRTPSEIVPLGSRQVGEVVCVIENPRDELLPGTNITAEIRSETVANALTIPKEAVRRPLGQAGVFALEGDHLEWRKVSEGVSSTTRVAVSGLKEGDAVALPTEKPLKSGMQVKPDFP